MAASKFQFRIFVVGMVIILSSLLAFSPAKAETVTYHGAYKASRHAVYVGSNVDFYYDLTIVTDDINAYGTVNVTGLGSFTYSGLVTYYSEIQVITDKGMSIVGSFTGTYNSVAQETTLNSTQYNSILTALNTINTTDQSIKNAVDSMKNSIMDILNNIDNIIDTISWTQYTDSFTYSLTYNGSSINTTGNTRQRTIYIDLPSSALIRKESPIIHLHYPIDGVSAEPPIIDISLYFYNSSDGTRYDINTGYYVKSNRNCIDLYLYNYRLYYSSNVRVEVSFAKSKHNIYVYQIEDYKMEYIGHDDIEYWQLLSFFDSVNQSSTEDLNNMNEGLDPVVDDMITNEDNLISDFDNSISNPNVKPSTNTYSDTSGWGTGFTSSIGFIGYIYNQLLQSSQGGNPFYMLINFSLMLGLALLIIGKRG